MAICNPILPQTGHNSLTANRVARLELSLAFMEHYYVACDLGAKTGRVTVGSLDKNRLELSEVHRFANVPTKEGSSLLWDIAQLYDELIQGLRKVAVREDPIRSVSCDSWAADYLLFDSDGTIINPTYHYRDARTSSGLKEVLSKVPFETLYEETGIQRLSVNTIFQLGAEKSRRLHKAKQLMPVADGFNFLLSGQPRTEASLASTTQLYNPFQQNWSDRLINTLKLPTRIFPSIVPAGTVLGPLLDGVAEQTGLEDVNVVASCSHDNAAAIVGLPVEPGLNWAYLGAGRWSSIGVELPHPIVTDAARELGFTNEAGYGGTVRFTKRTVGLWIVQECRRFWSEQEQDLDWDVMTHLAASSPPFVSLINPMDPRFLEPGDMPNKIKAFCRETDQAVPRKPGPIIRCALESIALHFRKSLREIENLTGRKIDRVHLIGDGMSNTLLNHFTANALQVPLVIGPTENITVGNLLVQAIAMGQVKSLEHARQIVSESFKTEVIHPHAQAWNEAYERMEQLV